MAEYQPAQLERIPKPSMEPPVRQKAQTPAASHPLVGLQARAGNQAIARMVQRAAEEEELQAKHDPSLQRSESAEDEGEELQAKHDPSLQRSESEEDEGESVQAKHDPSLQRSESEEDEGESLQAKHDPSLQRSESEEDEGESLQAKHDASLQRSESEEDEGESVQAKHDDLSPQVGLEGGPVGGDIEQRINSMRGSGSAAPEGIRRQMEAATGANLGGVRVHQDSESNALNHQLTAKAFTTGSDIFLRDDASTGDSELMAHEMAHVVQQSSGRTASGGGMAAGAANDPLEAEADSLAHSVISGSAQRHAEEATA